MSLEQISYSGASFMWHSAPAVLGSEFRDVLVLGGAHPDEYYAFANEIENRFAGQFNCSGYSNGTMSEPGFCQAEGECAQYLPNLEFLVIKIDKTEYSIPPAAMTYELQDGGGLKCRIGVVFHSAFTDSAQEVILLG